MRDSLLSEKKSKTEVLESEFHPDYNSYSNMELLGELEEKISTMTENNFDFDLIEKYLLKLQDKAPVMVDYEPATEFASWQRKYDAFFKGDKPLMPSRKRCNEIKKLFVCSK